MIKNLITTPKSFDIAKELHHDKYDKIKATVWGLKRLLNRRTMNHMTFYNPKRSR
jgi:hypothetical protein